MAKPGQATEPPIPFHRVLVDELNHQQLGTAIDPDEIEARRAELESRFAYVADDDDRERAVESSLVGEVYKRLHHSGVERTALCLSGGGIRSATFGLGLVQGLSRIGLLKSFDFLSTVSGGGYLGGWLSGWIARRQGDVADVERQLASAPLSPLLPEPDTVHHLRSYSRYMSPQLGLLSADTWTLVAIFVRNLLLNWLVLVPLLAFVLMIPRIGIILVPLSPPSWVQQMVLWCGAAAGSLAIAFIIANRPSLTSASPPGSTVSAKRQTQGAFLGLCLAPLVLIMAVAVTLFWAWTVPPAIDSLRFMILGVSTPPWIAFVLFGVLVHLGGFALSRYFVRSLAPLELLGVVVIGGLGGWLAWIAAWIASTRLSITPYSYRGTEIYVCCAVPTLLLVFLLGTILSAGVTSKYTSDEDREWIARAGAWILIWVFARTALSALVIFGPLAWEWAGSKSLAAAGGVSGLITLVLGFGRHTGTTEKQHGEPLPAGDRAANVALALAAPLFALSLLVGLSALTSILLGFLAGLADPGWLAGRPPVDSGFLYVVAYAPAWIVFAVSLAWLALGLAAGTFVDINRFSLHGAYRDRLIRAYLGASREPATRRPNPFTGFDDKDNLELRELQPNRPFHLVNVALNLVHGQDLALQDRKAESFTFSALHCGYRGGYRSSETYGRRKDGTRITLGTAVAISGAAASPNMGAHSSPVITFLLALFNIRLGWWLGNSGRAGAGSYQTSGPAFAPRALFDETFGLTDDQRPYVYLSDGGHFENLGLYEMVLRRCRYIVVSDAGQDGDFAFEDLGNAMAKIRIDLGIPIEFERLPMRARRDLRGKSYDSSPDHASFPYFAVARIRYSCVDYLETPGDLAEDVDGWLLYFKPALNGTEPADVFHYAKLHPTFPHESTGNQLYSEAQFESYRALGSHVVDSLSREPVGSVRELIDLARK